MNAKKCIQSNLMNIAQAVTVFKLSDKKTYVNARKSKNVKVSMT